MNTYELEPQPLNNKNVEKKNVSNTSVIHNSTNSSKENSAPIDSHDAKNSGKYMYMNRYVFLYLFIDIIHM